MDNEVARLKEKIAELQVERDYLRARLALAVKKIDRLESVPQPHSLAQPWHTYFAPEDRIDGI